MDGSPQRAHPRSHTGIGAAFDCHMGRVRQAPRWMQATGLEWVFRLTMEPRRLWKRYAKNNPRFVGLFLLPLPGARHFGAEGVAANGEPPSEA